MGTWPWREATVRLRVRGPEQPPSLRLSPFLHEGDNTEQFVVSRMKE